MTPRRNTRPPVQYTGWQAKQLNRRVHAGINQFARLMDMSRAGNVANASRRYYGESRQARELANFHAFMQGKANRGLAFGYSRNG